MRLAVLLLVPFLAGCGASSLTPEALVAPHTCVTRAGLPDHTCTPGETDPRVTQANIQQTICARGYTATVRPPTSVTNPIKRERMRAYGDKAPPSAYELDHLIPLELGGASTVANLWPEPLNGKAGAYTKDGTENRLKAEVCAGKITLSVAQQAIATNWKTAP